VSGVALICRAWGRELGGGVADVPVSSLVVVVGVAKAATSRSREVLPQVLSRAPQPHASVVPSDVPSVATLAGEFDCVVGAQGRVLTWGKGSADADASSLRDALQLRLLFSWGAGGGGESVCVLAALQWRPRVCVRACPGCPVHAMRARGEGS
jgi:hypothetical protein